MLSFKSSRHGFPDVLLLGNNAVVGVGKTHIYDLADPVGFLF